jgi:hypothetical protein
MADEPKTVETTETQTQEKYVPQSEVDRIISQRLAREQQKYSDYEDIKKKAETLEAEKKQREEAELTAAEKLQKEVEALNKSLKDTQLERDQFKEFKTNFEIAEQAKVDEAVKDLSESQRAVIDKLPLTDKMAAINEFRQIKLNSGDWGRRAREGEITIESIEEKKKKGDRTWRDDYAKLKGLK